MFKNIYPLFERKRLLKKEMLENLRDYPRNIFQIQYKDYSNGIFSGCDLTAVDSNIWIQPGIIFYKNIPYLLEEPCKIPYEATGKLTYLKFKCLEKVSGVEQDEYLSQIYLDDIIPDLACEIELARFKLQEGARLRYQYTDFFDYNTEFDTLNLIYVPYASPIKCSIYPEIVKTYARELIRYPIQNTWDYSFCMSCIQIQSVLPYEAVHMYLNLRLNQNKEDYSNEEIYHALKGILLASHGGGNNGKQNWNKDKKLLLI